MLELLLLLKLLLAFDESCLVEPRHVVPVEGLHVVISKRLGPTGRGSGTWRGRGDNLGG